MFILAGIPFFSLGTTFSVTVNSDSGAGSLRQAILDVNSTPGANIITFNIPGGDVQIIAPFSALPAVTNQVTIDAGANADYVFSGCAFAVDSLDGVAQLQLSLGGTHTTMKCSTHLNADAAAVCIHCGRALCPGCITKSESGRVVCSAACLAGLLQTEQALQSLRTRSA